MRALANALLSSGNAAIVTNASQLSVSLSPAQSGAPTFPNILPSLPPGVLSNITTMDPHMQNAYSEQGSFEIEQQIGEHATLSVGYQHLRGLHLIGLGMFSRWFHIVAAAAVLGAGVSVVRVDAATPAGPPLISALREGGYVLVMRHASSPPTPPTPKRRAHQYQVSRASA